MLVLVTATSHHIRCIVGRGVIKLCCLPSSDVVFSWTFSFSLASRLSLSYSLGHSPF